jgi:hypothetical protein
MASKLDKVLVKQAKGILKATAELPPEEEVKAWQEWLAPNGKNDPARVQVYLSLPRDP